MFSFRFAGLGILDGVSPGKRCIFDGEGVRSTRLAFWNGDTESGGTSILRAWFGEAKSGMGEFLRLGRSESELRRFLRGVSAVTTRAVPFLFIGGGGDFNSVVAGAVFWLEPERPWLLSFDTGRESIGRLFSLSVDRERASKDRDRLEGCEFASVDAFLLRFLNIWPTLDSESVLLFSLVRFPNPNRFLSEDAVELSDPVLVVLVPCKLLLFEAEVPSIGPTSSKRTSMFSTRRSSRGMQL